MPSSTPATVPSAPMQKPVVTKTLSSERRVAPIVRRMAISRVLARTSMISEERMLKTATSTMIESTTNIATRSTANASNSEALMVFQSVTMALPFSLRSRGARISPTLSGLVVDTSGLRVLHRHHHVSLVVIVDADLEDRGDAIGDLARNRAEGRGTTERVYHRNGVTHLRSQILRKLRTDRDIVAALGKFGEVPRLYLVIEPGKVLSRIAAHQNAFDPAVESGHQRLLDQRRSMSDAGRRANVLQHALPVVEPPAIGLDDGMAVEPDDLVEQFGAEAVHHAHDDHQRSDAEHDRHQADAGDEGNEALALSGQHVALGDGPFERG